MSQQPPTPPMPTPDDEFVVTPRPEAAGPADRGDGQMAGGTALTSAERAEMVQRRVANPDDPPVPAPLRDRRGRVPAPDSYFLGRMAIVQGQVYIVGVILIVQLWLVTTALFELLSGRPQSLWGLTIASGLGFIIALVVALWPRRRTKSL